MLRSPKLVRSVLSKSLTSAKTIISTITKTTPSHSTKQTAHIHTSRRTSTTRSHNGLVLTPARSTPLQQQHYVQKRFNQTAPEQQHSITPTATASTTTTTATTPAPQPIIETPEQMYRRLKRSQAEAAADARIAEYRLMQEENEMKAKTSPFTSLQFILLGVVFPLTVIGWKLYDDPTQIKLWRLQVRRYIHLWRNPQYRQLYAYFTNTGPLGSATIATECNLDRHTFNGNPESAEELKQRMTTHITSAQHVLYKEIGKAYVYIDWLNTFRKSLDEIMQIPGFKNDMQAEMQVRAMKQNQAEIDHLVSNLISGLVAKIERFEYTYHIDPNNAAAEYRPLFESLLAEQARLKLIDEYKVDSYKIAKKAKIDNREHTGIIVSERKTGKIGEQAVEKNAGTTPPTELIDGTDRTSLFVDFKPVHLPADETDESRRDVEIKMQLALHNNSQQMARMSLKEEHRDRLIKEMSDPDYQGRRLIPWQLESKPMSQYSDYEMQLGCFLDLQHTILTVQTISGVLEVVINEIGNQKFIIEEQKKKYLEQEKQKEIINEKRAKSLRDGNFFTDNTLDNSLSNSREKQISPYDFVFDYDKLLQLVDKEVFRYMGDSLHQGLEKFWEINTNYVLNRESLVKALELFPEVAPKLQRDIGLTEDQIRNLPHDDMMIGRLISFPSCIDPKTMKFTQIQYDNYFTDIKRENIIFLGEFDHTLNQQKTNV